MGKSIVLLGTLDTKGAEYQFLRELVVARGHEAIVVDVSCKPLPEGYEADIACSAVAREGGLEIEDINAQDRRAATRAIAGCAAKVVLRLYESGKLDGLLAIGGSNGTAIAGEAMRALPIGVPKVLVSTMASGDMHQYIGIKDIATLFSVGDICLNRVTRRIYANAVGAVIGMAETIVPPPEREAHLIGVTMFGLTQPCVFRVRDLLEARGFEVMFFHSVGTGGVALGELIDQGMIDGVIDVTTSELVDEVGGGVFTAGPDRLEAASRKGIPQVIVPGAIDLVDFWSNSVPERCRDRFFHRFNSEITLMRSDVEENRAVARLIAGRVNRANGPAVVMVPARGFSDLDRSDGRKTVDFQGNPAGPWFDPTADEAFVDELRSKMRGDAVELVDAHINDPDFADRLVDKLLSTLGERVP